MPLINPNIMIYGFLVYPLIGKLSLIIPKNIRTVIGNDIIVVYNYISPGDKFINDLNTN